jgi:hypothetical protein
MPPTEGAIMMTRHGRRDFLKISATALCGASCWGRLARARSAGEDQAVHGMLVAGERTVFLSHLPMFGPPHDYQVILEAAFAKPGSDPQADYFRDRQRTGATLYTIEPERFDLLTIPAHRPMRLFTANLYRGHFERFATSAAKDAARIAQDVNVTITRVVHFAQFDPAAAKPTHLEYLLFGKGDELFLAHLVTSPPDFDQILTVKLLNHTFTDAELRHGARVVISGRGNAAADRITGVRAVTGEFSAADGTKSTLLLEPGEEIYLEQRELAS